MQISRLSRNFQHQLVTFPKLKCHPFVHCLFACCAYQVASWRTLLRWSLHQASMFTPKRNVHVQKFRRFAFERRSRICICEYVRLNDSAWRLVVWVCSPWCSLQSYVSALPCWTCVESVQDSNFERLCQKNKTFIS